MRWAITPRGAGILPGFRPVRDDDATLAPGEAFITTTDPRDMVLDADGETLRAPTQAERFEVLRATRRDQLRTARDAYIEAGVQFKSVRFYSDRQSIGDVAQAMVGFLMLATLSGAELASLPSPPPTTVRWKTADGHVDLTPKEIALLLARLSVHQQTAYALEEQALLRLAAARTEAEILGVSLQ